MKVVILDGYALNPGDLSWEPVKSAVKESGEEIELIVYDRTPPGETIKRMEGAQAVFTNKTIIDKNAIDSSNGLQFIGVLATGYNVVDVKAAADKNIPVCNVPGYSTPSVAQQAFSLLLEICIHAGEHSRAVHEGRWVNAKDYCFWDYPLIELSGKTLGIIGLGTIGKATARVARSFGMNVIAYSRRANDEGRACAEYVSLDELLSRSDVISLHCPAFPETTGMINKNSIAKMKDGVIIINTSRGALIVEADLAQALNAGKVYAAGVDVLSTEPPAKDNPLLTAKNCVITPHIAWAPKESRIRLLDITADNLRSFLAGKPKNVVN